MSWFEREHHSNQLCSSDMICLQQPHKLNWNIALVYWISIQYNWFAVDGVCVCIDRFLVVVVVFYFSFVLGHSTMFIFVVWTNSWKIAFSLTCCCCYDLQRLLYNLKKSIEWVATTRIHIPECMGNISAQNDYTNYLSGHVSKRKTHERKVMSFNNNWWLPLL